jgi:outer membrane protein
MRILAVFLSLTLMLPAQVKTSMNSSVGEFSTPWFGTPGYFKKHFGHLNTKVTLQPPVRLKDFVVDGKLRLSLHDYLDLVIANNTDIGIQRLTLETPKNAIQRAFGVFDPTVTSSYSANRSQTPATDQLQGAAVVSQLNQPFSARFSELTPFSTTLFSQVQNTRLSTNSQFALLNPSNSTTLTMGFTQPLLRNRGRYITKLPITIARAQKAQSEFSFYDQVMRLLVTAENAYWDVINSRERLRVQREGLKLAEAALERTRREVELGATSPLEIFQPEQNAATARISVTQFEYQLKQFEDALRRQIGADIDPDVRDVPIELTEKVEATADNTVYDREKLVALAMSKRPDLKVAQMNLDINDLQIRTNLEALRPRLDFQGQYSTTGRGGVSYDRTTTPATPIPGGILDAFGQWFTYSTYFFSLNLTLPLRDRAGAANLADSVVTKRSNALRLRSTEQQIRQDVLNGITQVESSREGVKLAEIALDFARKRADADQKRYDLGVINIFFLLSSQNDLTTAESNLVTQTVQYKRNLLNLQQRLGTLLEDRGIVLQ